MPVAPEEYRGSISMLLVSERVSLPRETVRRKVQGLIKRGLVFRDDKGRMRAVSTLAQPEAQRMVRESFAAVKRYDARLRQLGLAGITRPTPRQS
jgi:DNA-binding IclR family transcriptional regulator